MRLRMLINKTIINVHCLEGLVRASLWSRTGLTHAHKEYSDLLDLLAVANDFAALSNHRINLFGKFNE